MTIKSNKRVFDNKCSLIFEEVREDSTKSVYFCGFGFVETLETAKSYTFSSYAFGYMNKFDKGNENNHKEIKPLF